MSVDELIRSSLNEAAEKMHGQPAEFAKIKRRGARRRRVRYAGWGVATVVSVVAFVVVATPLDQGVDLAEAPTPREILADRVVTGEEWRAAGAAVVQCLTERGLEAEFDPVDGQFDVLGEDSDVNFEECWGTHIGVTVEQVWADQQYDPVADFEFYRDVVECTESITGVDYGDMTQDSLGFTSTEAQRTIDRALEEAPDIYDSCFEEVSLAVPARASSLADVFLAGSRGGLHYSLGLDAEGSLCAQVGFAGPTNVRRTAVCGVDDLEAIAYEDEGMVALAGYAPDTVGGITAVINDEIRLPLVLVPIPGQDLYGYGIIEDVELRFVELEITDETGAVVQRYFPSATFSDD